MKKKKGCKKTSGDVEVYEKMKHENAGDFITGPPEATG